jgi:hypothetical protein
MAGEPAPPLKDDGTGPEAVNKAGVSLTDIVPA